MTLFLWGYVHFTYIVNSEDCLINITERPFPNDVILQVEVYSNSSDVWQEREKALQVLYDNTYGKKTVSGKKFNQSGGLLSIGWIRNFCETSFVVNLTGTNFFCQLMLAELFNVYENSRGDETSMNDVENVTGHTVDINEVCTVNSNSTCRRRNFYESLDISSKTSIHSSDGEMLSEAEFFSLNYTLYDLIDFYSKL